MKYILLILLISGCTKISKGDLSLVPKKDVQLSTLEEDFSDFEERIDVMVAFLWPLKVTTKIQREAMKNVIANSRKLRSEQEAFTLKKLELKHRFKDKDCECILNGLCEDEMPEDDGSCLELESEMFEHDRKLVAIFELIDQIESDVAASGGEWLKTHVDFPELPSSSFSFQTFNLDLTVLDVDKDDSPFTYEKIPLNAFQESTYKRFKTTFPRLGHTGLWELDLSYKRASHSVSFQGDLYYWEGPVKREGVIYWENLRRE